MYSLNRGLITYLFDTSGGEPILEKNLYLLFYIGLIALVVAVSYLLGSVNSAIVVSKLLYKDDIRKHGSGNAGMTNMLRTYGKGAAGLTLLGDVMKTVIAIFFAAIFFGFQYLRGVCVGIDEGGVCYIAGMCVVFGHIFPCFYNFKGGKGVLATATMALMLSPIVFLILFIIFIAIVALSKYVSLGSVTVAALYPVVLSGYFSFTFAQINQKPETALYMPMFAALSSIVLAILIVWSHRENLKRISNRTENKLSFGKKHEDEE